LKALDDKIEQNNKINAELEDTARDLYNYWFIQFDFPDEFRRPYKSSGGKMVYNDVLKREIPEGWEVKNLLDIVEWISGAQPPKATFIYQPQNGYVRFIQNRDYAGDTNVTYIKESKNNKVCDVFDIMMDKYGDAGRVRYGLAGAYNVALSKIKVNVLYGQEYIRKFLESDSVYNYLYNACMASTRASLNGEILGNLNIAIPNDTLLKNFEMRNKQIINQILQNKQENEILSNLRDFLLPMLMNGQVSVSD
jgi:type I restriction enzyme S subunit